MNFQTIVHDGFFNNPDKVREWGLTLDYQHPDGTYPGVRTRCTKFIHKKFYEATASKLISLWGVYDRKDWDIPPERLYKHIFVNSVKLLIVRLRTPLLCYDQ